MDVIKQMIANRVAQGVKTNAPPETKAEQIRVQQKKKSLRERRMEIIENKPKPKHVLQYFEDVISQEVESSSEED